MRVMGKLGVKAFIGILILTFSLSLVCTGGDGWAQIISIAKKKAGGGTTYPDILFYDGFEGATNAAKPSDKARTLKSGAALDNGSTPTAPVGSYSLDCPSEYDRAQYSVSSADIISGAEGRLGLYIYIESVTGAPYIFDYSVDGSNIINAYLTTGRAVYFYYKAGGESMVITSSVTITAETWTFVEIAWDNAGNSYKIYIDGTERGSATDNLPDWAGTGGTLQIGETSGNSGNFHVDQVIISNDATRDLNAIKSTTSFPSS